MEFGGKPDLAIDHTVAVPVLDGLEGGPAEGGPGLEDRRGDRKGLEIDFEAGGAGGKDPAEGGRIVRGEPDGVPPGQVEDGGDPEAAVEVLVEFDFGEGEEV
jgi:hypothetical protein